MQSIDSISGLPVSAVISVESSRSLARIRPATSRSSFAFSTPGTFHQACWARAAAATASATSSALAVARRADQLESGGVVDLADGRRVPGATGRRSGFHLA